jgi:AcrR family transcriptional regulator
MPRPSRWPEIVDAAAKAFRQKGFDATSLEDIANEVGIWKGSLYHYINSKEDLLFAVVRAPADRILAEVRALVSVDLPPAERIRQATRSHVRVLEENFVYAAVYLQEIAGRNRSAEWSAMDREYVSCLEWIIQDGITRGDFADTLNPRITTLALIGSLNWLTHWYRPEGSLTAEAIADHFTDMFLGGLLARGPVARHAVVTASPARPVKRPRAVKAR